MIYAPTKHIHLSQSANKAILRGDFLQAHVSGAQNQSDAGATDCIITRWRRVSFKNSKYDSAFNCGKCMVIFWIKTNLFKALFFYQNM